MEFDFDFGFCLRAHFHIHARARNAFWIALKKIPRDEFGGDVFVCKLWLPWATLGFLAQSTLASQASRGDPRGPRADNIGFISFHGRSLGFGHRLTHGFSMPTCKEKIFSRCDRCRRMPFFEKSHFPSSFHGRP